jgi:putative aldouronate transport system substrate-binding protein
MSAKKKAITRRSFLTLTGASLVSGLAAACAAAPTAAPAAPAQPASGGDTAAQPAAATQAPAPAEAPAAEGLTELIYVYTNFVGIPKDQAVVEEALNKITTERIGAKLSLVNLEFGAFNDKIQLMSAGGEKYDLAYTASWTNDYYKNVSNGVFVELDDLLKARAPGLWKSMPETTWNAAKVKGKLYAAINQQIFPPMGGFVMKKPIAEKYKVDVNTINSWADLEPIVTEIKTGENIIPMAGGSEMLQETIMGYSTIDGAAGFLWVKPDDASATPVLNFDAPTYKENWDLVRRWQEAGYLPADITKFDQEVANMKDGKAVIKTEPAVKPRGEAEFTLRYASEIVQRALAKPILGTGNITATLTGVSRTGNAEKSVDWLELVNTDKGVFNLMCFGIEGRHWNWKDQNTGVIEQVKDSGYDPTTDWMFGNQFNAYYRNESQVGAWDETKKLNDSATPSPTLGFVLDREPVKNEIAAVTAVLAEVTPLGARGQNSSAFPKAIADAKAAGLDKIVAEMTKQIEAWKAAT